MSTRKSCPYCFGQRQDMASGRYETFCDWQPGRDPVRFGFPPDVRRDARANRTGRRLAAEAVVADASPRG